MSPEAMNANNFSASYTDTLAGYDQQNMDNYDSQFKTFYNKIDSTGPYATTAILVNVPPRVSGGCEREEWKP